MRTLITLFSVLASIAVGSFGPTCNAPSADYPMKLVTIKGRAIQFDSVSKKELPATTDTIIFQNTKCSGCFIAAKPDSNGNYRIMVGDGVYRVIVRDPASPDEDLLDKNQERIVDTGGENSPQQEFELNLRIRANVR